MDCKGLGIHRGKALFLDCFVGTGAGGFCSGEVELQTLKWVPISDMEAWKMWRRMDSM